MLFLLEDFFDGLHDGSKQLRVLQLLILQQPRVHFESPIVKAGDFSFVEHAKNLESLQSQLF